MKSKVKDFLGQSKKLVQAPKELPEIRGAPALPMIKKEQPAPQPFVPSTATKPKPEEPVKKDLSLPRIDHPAVKEKPHETATTITDSHDDDLKQFENAINNINIDVIHTEAPEKKDAQVSEQKEQATEEYYKPLEIGEGYFSEIEHFLKNKDVKEIIDDILKKDFLVNMKDYHDTKIEGKQFFLHKKDLDHKLKKKMNHLRKLEDEWHELKTQIRERDRKKKELEQGIDKESQELKELFKQVKISHWLEQEAPKDHYFKLRSGQEIKSLNDLRKALSYISEEEFKSHVNEEKNDFATWTQEALQNQELYEKIKEIKTKEELEEVLKNPL